MYHAIFILKKETKIEKVEFLLLLTHVCNNMYLFIYLCTYLFLARFLSYHLRSLSW